MLENEIAIDTDEIKEVVLRHLSANEEGNEFTQAQRDAIVTAIEYAMLTLETQLNNQDWIKHVKKVNRRKQIDAVRKLTE